MGAARLWAVVSLATFAATITTMAAGLRRVFETGQPSAANGHYMVASILAVLVFLALAGMEHGDGPDAEGKD